MDINNNIDARFLEGKQQKIELACCYCKSRFLGDKIINFTSSNIGKKPKSDIPLCPNCFVDKVVYFTKLIGKTEDDKMNYLDELHNFWYNDSHEESENDDVSDNDDDSQNTIEIKINNFIETEVEPVKTKEVKAKPKPVKVEPVKTKEVKTKPVKVEPVKTKQVKTKEVKTKPVKTVAEYEHNSSSDNDSDDESDNCESDDYD